MWTSLINKTWLLFLNRCTGSHFVRRAMRGSWVGCWVTCRGGARRTKSPQNTRTGDWWNGQRKLKLLEKEMRNLAELCSGLGECKSRRVLSWVADRHGPTLQNKHNVRSCNIRFMHVCYELFVSISTPAAFWTGNINLEWFENALSTQIWSKSQEPLSGFEPERL